MSYFLAIYTSMKKKEAYPPELKNVHVATFVWKRKTRL